MAEGMYSKSSPVLQIDRSNYDSLIAKSNHTSILEFYAPWCGHCQSLKPAYEKAAKSLSGLAKVAAVNCDEEPNKPLCGEMGVKGFPTLKVVKPGKKPGRPIVEEYQGARSAKAIVDAVTDKIPNHVKRLKDDDYEAWLEEGDAPKAILFSEKGTTSALLKALAIDFLGAINVAQIRSKETRAVEAFHVNKFPSLVLHPGGDKSPVTYDGDMKKDAMTKFLSQAAQPNPDPAPKKAKSTKSKSDKKASSEFAKSSASQASSQAKTDKASQTMESLEDDPTASPDPNVVTDDTEKPIKVPDVAPPIPSIGEGLSLQQQCLNTKSSTCVLAVLSGDAAASEGSTQALASLSEIHQKHAAAKRTIFPFFQLAADNKQTATLRAQLGFTASSFELIAVNGKRGWYRKYPKTSFSQAEVEDWIDAIRMGDGAKEKVPEGLLVPLEDLPQEKIEVKLDDDRIITDFRGQMPEGMDFEMEEISDEELEWIMADASAKAAEAKEAKETPVAEKVDVVEERDEL